MRNLKTIENRVLAVLKEHPEARNDDMKLYLLVSKNTPKHEMTI